MRNFLGAIFMVFLATTIQAQSAEQIVADMVETIGGKSTFYNLGNVTYNYEYTDPNGGTNKR